MSLNQSRDNKSTKILSNELQNILDKTVNKSIFGTTVCIKSKDMDWCGVSGNFQKDDQFFVASVTKLFITTLLLKLRQEQKISLDEKISRYLPENTIDSLHIFNGVGYSHELTIRQLMAHTSGLPDYFQQKRENGKSLEDELLSGQDQHWSFEKSIVDSKKMKPLFKPDQKGKAHYSDTNYQLLGSMIETLYHKRLETIINDLIAKPLGLTKTYLYKDYSDSRPKNIFYKNRELQIPKAMSSFGADGGIVSTASELMTFIEAFFSGKLFPVEYMKELQKWNRIFFPLQSGIGIHRYKLPWIFSPFKPIPEVIGHSGLSGAFAFYCPSKDIYLAGTVNQIDQPEIPFRLIIKVLNAVIDLQ